LRGRLRNFSHFLFYKIVKNRHFARLNRYCGEKRSGIRIAISEIKQGAEFMRLIMTLIALAFLMFMNAKSLKKQLKEKSKFVPFFNKNALKNRTDIKEGYSAR
jgi:hypothetical protein